MIPRTLFLALALALWAATSHAAALTACTTGQTTCSNDTTNDALIVSAINDPVVQQRVWNLWNQQCAFIFSEATSTAGHNYRNNFCLAIAAGKVPLSLLVSSVMDSTVVGEVLAGSQPGPTPGGGQAAGNMVDVDVNTAIDTVLTVGVSAANTTATASSGSEALTVASATGVFAGQSAVCAGCAAGAQVAAVNGTTVYLTAPVTAALSATPINFTFASGLPTRSW